MAKLVRFDAPRSASVVDAPEPDMAADQVRIRTLFSGISAGTELTAYRGTNPYLNSRWDDDARLFVPGKSTFEYPVDGWGYEEVGEVVEVGAEAEGVQLGDVIWGAWGHREIVVRSAKYAAHASCLPGRRPIRGIFSHIGAIALNGILDADIHVGETVAVFGVGVPGPTRRAARQAERRTGHRRRPRADPARDGDEARCRSRHRRDWQAASPSRSAISPTGTAPTCAWSTAAPTRHCTRRSGRSRTARAWSSAASSRATVRVCASVRRRTTTGCS